MGFEDYLDMDVFYSISFWLLGGGMMIAFLLGFKLTTAWGLAGVEQQFEIAMWTKILLLLFSWVIAYFWVWKLK